MWTRRGGAAGGGGGSGGGKGGMGSQALPRRVLVLMAATAVVSAWLTARAMLWVTGTTLGGVGERSAAHDFTKDPDDSQGLMWQAQGGCAPRAEVAAARAAKLQAGSEALGRPVASLCELETFGGGADADTSRGEAFRRLDADTLRYARIEFAPQIAHNHMRMVEEALSRRHDSNFLVFGSGVDSPLYHLLSRCGRVVFVEDDPDWAARVCSWVPDAEMVVYSQYRGDASVDAAADASTMADDPACGLGGVQGGGPLPTACPLLMALDADLLEVPWDVVMVDGPVVDGQQGQGTHPGRAQSAYTAAALAQYSHRAHGRPVDWFLHDCEQPPEAAFTAALWGEHARGHWSEVEPSNSGGELPVDATTRHLCHVHLE